MSTNTNKYGKTIGRVTLFHAKKEGKMNEPDMKGYLETPKGKYTISLWSELNDKVTGGEIFKGQVKEQVNQ